MDDRSLIEQVIRAQGGDEDAIRVLIEATQDGLYRFAIYLTNNEVLAQDLCQETYIKMIEQISKLKNPGGLNSWLFQILKNKFFDIRKSPKYKSSVALESVSEEAIGVVEEDRAEVIHLMRGLQEVDEDQRMAILLVDLEGHSYAEAAKILGISESALRSRLHRARQVLVNTMEIE